MIGKMKQCLKYVLLSCCLVWFIPSVVQAGTYDPNKAVEYAYAHYNTSSELCAGFVSDCLNYGGAGIQKNRGVRLLREAVEKSPAFTEYQLTGSYGNLYYSNNVGKVAVGDPLFYYCGCEGPECTHPATDNPNARCYWLHAAIVTKIENNIIKVTQTNSAEKDSNAAWIKACEHQTFFVLHYNGNAVPTGELSVSKGYADGITKTNAVLHGHVYKSPNMYVSECGVYLGTSKDTMVKLNTETVSSGANNKDGGTGFDIWYDLNGELGQTLNPNTTYFYKFYCTYGGKEYQGGVNQFTTASGAVTVEYDQKVYVEVPANYLLQGYQYVESTVKYRKIDPQPESYSLTVDRWADLANGTRRFYYVDGNGYGIWFEITDQMRCYYYASAIQLESDSYVVDVGEKLIFKGGVSPANCNEPIYGSDGIYSRFSGYGNIYLTDSFYTLGNVNYTFYGSYSGVRKAVTVQVVDRKLPVINKSDVKITNVNGDGFDVTWTISDNYELNKSNSRIRVYNESESLAGATAVKNMTIVSQTDKKVTYKYHVKVKDHAKPYYGGTYTVVISGSDTSDNVAKRTVKVEVPAKSYTIAYYANGGSGAPAKQTKIHNKNIKLSTKKPTRKGYRFKEWNTKKSGSGTYYDPGDTYKKNGSVSLYAQWKPIKYTVKFDKNGATSGTMEKLSCVYNKEYRLKKCTFKRKGYTFKGWCKNKKGDGTIYKDATAIKNLTATNDKTVTLYAIWKKNK